jgi:hypothetical protein
MRRPSLPFAVAASSALAFFLTFSLASSVAIPARADKPAPPAERLDASSPYERQTIAQAVAKLKAVVDPSPQGKIVEGVDVVTLEVFEPRDPMPALITPLANWFHVTTKKHVIEREVLLAPGEPWDQGLVDETARNLRGLDQLSLVLCVPLRGGAPDRVRLLVITKDVWSLRLNSNFRFAGGRLQYLLLQPSEVNLLGEHQSILGNFSMDPATIAVGGSYVLPRLAGSRVNASVSGNAVLNRDTGKVEGSYGSLAYGQPLYSTRAKWAWGASLSWDYQIVRRFIGGLATDFDPSQGACAVPAVPAIGGASDGKQCQYRRDVMSGAYAVTRSWGSAYKHNLSVGFSASRKQYRTLDLSALTPADQQAYRAALVPVSDNVNAPYLEYHDYENRYVDILDGDTLGLTESYQRGHDVTVRITPATTALRSSRNFVSVSASATYTLPIGDGLARAAISSSTELTTTGVPDGSISVGFRMVTPRFGHGRLVFDAGMLDRYANYLNVRNTLGGDGRLRGYPASMFIGKDYVLANLEYRSDPVEFMSVQAGFVLFIDAGDAFDTFDKMHLKQSTGFGLRLVFPQLERSVMRIDAGFPLTLGVLPASQYHGDVVVTFGQAF